MSCVCDTHSTIWYLFASHRLSSDAKQFIDSILASQGRVFVPSISIIEAIYLMEKGRLDKSTLQRMLHAINAPNSGFEFVDIDSAVAQALQQIPRVAVPDMPDRIIAATALHLNLPLVTKDRNIRALQSIQTIW